MSLPPAPAVRPRSLSPAAARYPGGPPLEANTAPESYFGFSHALSFAINEIATAFFLALVAQEVCEALTPGGALHEWRLWSMTLVAAGGGAAGTAAVYLGYVHWKYERVLATAAGATLTLGAARALRVGRFAGAPG